MDEWVTGIRLRGGLRDALAAADEGVVDLQAHPATRAVQIVLGHTKIESTVRYLGVDVEDALVLAEGTEI